jgi:hypothetical protein
MILVSCRKGHDMYPPPPDPVKKILLKDIIMPHLPSPYYHFDYNTDSTVAKVSFASGYTMYDVLYNRNRISEMRNNIIVNHDTLRYLYDNMSRVAIIKFINDTGLVYRHVFFSYDGYQVKEIEWDHKVGDVGFIIDRTLTFTYFTDGNVKEIKEHRPAIEGQTEINFVTHFDQYDDKINVDDFMLLHDGIHDHLFLPSGFRIQKNNPRKEIRTGDGVNYSVDYTYTYNNDSAPLTKTGELVFTSGSQAGQEFQVNTSYTYY